MVPMADLAHKAIPEMMETGVTKETGVVMELMATMVLMVPRERKEIKDLKDLLVCCESSLFFPIYHGCSTGFLTN